MLRWGLSRTNCFFAIRNTTPLLASDPGHDLPGDRLRHLLVRMELHGRRGPSLGLRPQVSNVAEHLGERHLGADDLAVAPLLHALHLPPPAVEVADDLAHV